jgi:hypothetical protein
VLVTMIVRVSRLWVTHLCLFGRFNRSLWGMGMRVGHNGYRWLLEGRIFSSSCLLIHACACNFRDAPDMLHVVKCFDA